MKIKTKKNLKNKMKIIFFKKFFYSYFEVYIKK